MSTKFIEVCTTDFRKFVSTLLELGAKGGVLTDECRAVKGLLCRARVQVPEESVIEITPIMTVIVTESKKPAKVSLTEVVKDEEPKQVKKRGRAAATPTTESDTSE